MGVSIGRLFSGPGTDNNIVTGNYIGTNSAGTTPISNLSDGVRIENSASGNTIGGTAAGASNLVSGNFGNGITVLGEASLGNQFRGNAIYNNDGLGIDLGGDGVTPNDVLDADGGPNNLQNFPLLTRVLAGAQTRVMGALKALAEATFTLDFYANTAADASGFDEGKPWLGSIGVTTQASGKVAFTEWVAETASGEFVTVTATDENGNTSEFSAVCAPEPRSLAACSTT
jgi:hypothetical protein